MAIALRKKTIVIIIVVLVIIGGGLATALVYFTLQLKAQQTTQVATKPSTTIAKTICTDDTLTQAAAAITYPQDSAKLETIATGIMSTTDYTSDVNCLYVVLQYNLAFSQAADARTNLNSLKGLYNSSVGYSKILGDNASPPEVLEKMVASLETSSANFIKSDKIPVEDESAK
jgi:hypothetical protein